MYKGIDTQKGIPLVCATVAGKSAIHWSAWASLNRLILGQTKV